MSHTEPVPQPKATESKLVTFLKEIYGIWVSERPTQFAAALAYYAIFSFVPVIYIAVTITDLVIERLSVEEQFYVVWPLLVIAVLRIRRGRTGLLATTVALAAVSTALLAFLARDGCRSCGSSRLERVLDLGETPLANALPSEEELGKPEARYPLDPLAVALPMTLPRPTIDDASSDLGLLRRELRRDHGIEELDVPLDRIRTLLLSKGINIAMGTLVSLVERAQETYDEKQAAKLCTMRVLAVPGTPSSSTWPRQSSATRTDAHSCGAPTRSIAMAFPRKTSSTTNSSAASFRTKSTSTSSTVT